MRPGRGDSGGGWLSERSGPIVPSIEIDDEAKIDLRQTEKEVSCRKPQSANGPYQKSYGEKMPVRSGTLLVSGLNECESGLTYTSRGEE